MGNSGNQCSVNKKLISSRKVLESCVTCNIYNHIIVIYNGGRGGDYNNLTIYNVACRVHPALGKCSRVIRFYVNDSPLVHLSMSTF